MAKWNKLTAILLTVMLAIPAQAVQAETFSASSAASSVQTESAAEAGESGSAENGVPVGPALSGSSQSDPGEQTGAPADGGSIGTSDGSTVSGETSGTADGTDPAEETVPGTATDPGTEPGSGTETDPGTESDPQQETGELSGESTAGEPAGEGLPSEGDEAGGAAAEQEPGTSETEEDPLSSEKTGTEEEKEEEEPEAEPVVSYRVSLSSQGWLPAVSSGKWTGIARGTGWVEGLSVSIEETDALQIQYRVRMADTGWTSWAKNGAECGGPGSGRKAQALQVRLAGEKKDDYTVCYSVYASGFGWMNWASNGASAGTCDIGVYIRKVKICLVKKGEAMPGQISDISAAYAATGVSYKGYRNGTGWLPSYVKNGAALAGPASVLGQLRLTLKHPECGGELQYRTSLAESGWESWVTPGTSSGVKNKTIQAVQIRLTGDLAAKYNIYYCVNVEGYGWLNWAANGAVAGAGALKKGITNICVRILPKGVKAPAAKGSIALAHFIAQKLSYSAYVQRSGWTGNYGSGKYCGKAGSKRWIEALKISLPSQKIAGSIAYKGHVQDVGWESTWSKDGAVSGEAGSGRRYEAVRIKLTGDLSGYFDIWYRVYVQDMGWMGWTKNGGDAGTSGLNRRIESIQIRTTAKGAAAPGSTDLPFKTGNRSAEIEKQNSQYLRLYVPQVLQNPELPTGCESVALMIVLKSYGYILDKTTIADNYMPYGYDFVTTYVGDPHSQNGQSIMAPGLVTTADRYLTAMGSKARGHEITGTSFSNLYKQLEKGRPVIMWATSYMRQPVILSSRVYNGKTYYWYGEEHCMVMYGYNKKNGTVLIADPISGLVSRKASAMEAIYNKAGKCAMVIY